MFGITLAVALLAVSPAESQAAFAHRATLPPDVAAYTWYLSLSDVPPEQQFKLEAATQFAVCSLSAKPNIDSHRPYRVDGTPLLAINTLELGWSPFYEQGISKLYIYRPDIQALHKTPIVVSALWFVATVTDPNESGELQYQLLYGKHTPKSAKEFLAFWQANNRQQFFLGLIEGKSGVSVQGHRTIENRPVANRGYAWLTKDSRRIAGKTDPLENLIPGSVKFDASEYIVGVPKQVSGKSGTLQAYFLSDASGTRQEKAPADIVTDHLQTRTTEIRNFVSCVGCHGSGINPPSVDEYREYIIAWAGIHTYDRATKEQIEAYLEGDLGKEIRRNQEDFDSGAMLACGYPATVVSGFFTEAVRIYDRDVDLVQAARELGCEPRELSLALGWASEHYVALPARLAQLAHGKAMTRDAFEQNFYPAYLMLQEFRK